MNAGRGWLTQNYVTLQPSDVFTLGSGTSLPDFTFLIDSIRLYREAVKDISRGLPRSGAPPVKPQAFRDPEGIEESLIPSGSAFVGATSPLVALRLPTATVLISLRDENRQALVFAGKPSIF